MRSMKTLLRLMGAVALSTVAASSVVACGTNTKAPELNGKYATLLGWYGADNKTSLIEQELKNDDTTGKEKYAIDAVATMITATKFKDTLLTTGSKQGEFKAKDADAAKFLVDLGFKSGSESKDYSKADVDAITALSAKVTSSEAGKVEANAAKNDFNVAAGTCQISIMDKAGDGSKVVKSYTINTLKKDTLGIPTAVASLVTLDNLDLTKAKGYAQNGPVLKALVWKSDKSAEHKKCDSLAKLFGKESLLWTSDRDGTTELEKYPATGKVYLTMKFGEVKVMSSLEMDAPTLSY